MGRSSSRNPMRTRFTVEHPTGSLLALYVVVAVPEAWCASAKLAGEVAPNPVTGQLVDDL